MIVPLLFYGVLRFKNPFFICNVPVLWVVGRAFGLTLFAVALLWSFLFKNPDFKVSPVVFFACILLFVGGVTPLIESRCAVVRLAIRT